VRRSAARLAPTTETTAVHRVLLVAIVVFAAWTHLVGVRGDLPWAYESDEGKFAVLSLQMATTGDPNPRWFGHPGSTLVYPLAAIFHVANAVDAGLPLLQVDPGLAARVGGDPGRYFLFGRFLTVLYAVAALPLVFAIGRRAFDPTTGVVAAWLAVLSPLALLHAQLLRTDSAGLFFGCLGLLLSLRVLDRPSRGAHALAGLALGVAIGTRYFLVTFVPALVCADLVLLSRLRGRPGARRALIGAAMLGLACVGLGFFLSTPYFLLDFGSVWQNLAHEMRDEHLGADGRGFTGNLAWYLTSALPASMPAAWIALGASGLLLAAVRRRVAALLVALVAVLFLVAISTAALHWQRWLIQIVPLFAVFVAAALVALAALVARTVPRRPRATAVLVVLLTGLVSALPARDFVHVALLQARPSTRIAAREWIVANVPPGSTIAADFYTAPLHDTELRADYHFALAADGDVDHYRDAGVQYLMISDAIYSRYLREAQRYPREVAFYRSLLDRGRLVKRFSPIDAGRGPTISLYALP